MTSNATNVKLVILRLSSLVSSDCDSILNPEGAREAYNEDHQIRESTSPQNVRDDDSLLPLEIRMLGHTRQTLAQAPDDIVPTK
jgi:hypothetical protein